MQRTLVLLKPDCVQRRLAGQMISRFEDKGLGIVAMKMMRVDKSLAAKHYAEHVEKAFFPSLVAFITRGPVVAMVWEGQEAVAVARTMLGATDAAQAVPGTIRGDFSLSKEENIVHGSDGPQSAAGEIALFFAPDELV